MVCEVTRQGKFLIAEPFFSTGDRFALGRGGAAAGDLVLVVPDERGNPQVSEKLGDPAVALDVIAALLHERDIDTRLAPAALREASEVVRSPDASGRRDLRDLPTFTIDPVTAKDFDDAISAERVGDAIRIYVHIADVSAFVRPGGAIDESATLRATSVYVPGLVAPMLPPQLADDACSLVPGADRLALTITLDVTAGQCRGATVERSIIRSDERLDYDQVDRIFSGEERAQDPWAVPLELAREVARSLIKGRVDALELDIPEPEFSFDERGEVVGQRPSEHTESHRLIEQLMVLANEQVATLLHDRGTPALYRIHEKPTPSAAEKLIDQLASLGVPTPTLPDQMTPEEAQSIVAACSVEVAKEVRRTGYGRTALPVLILRALKQASYRPDSLGHAGLGLTRYCHFTSPIRRYPDLVCHRGVLGEGPPELTGEALLDLAKHCSEKERDSMAVEREADRIAKAFLLDARMRSGGAGEVFQGEVTGMTGAGLFVNFGGGFDGFIPVRTLRGDWWEMNEENTAIIAQQSGAVIHLGDAAKVVVDSVDKARGRVDLHAVALGAPATK